MNDWVNWQQYSDAVTPEAQRLADEREKLRTSQREQMLAATEQLKGSQQSQIRAGGRGEVSELPGYQQLLKQQQAGEQTWAQSQARGWESMLGDQQPQASGWEGLSRRLGDLQARGQMAVKQRDADAEARAARERKEGKERIEAQGKAAERARAMQAYQKYLADNYGWEYADRFAKFPQAEQDRQLFAFQSGVSRDEGLSGGRAPLWRGTSAALPSAAPRGE